VVTSQSRAACPVTAGWVMACWQRKRQFTQPPAAARRLRVDIRVVKTSAAATAAPAVAVITVIMAAAAPKKWLTGPENISHATVTMASSQLAGRA
jgi:hypothetical protein